MSYSTIYLIADPQFSYGTKTWRNTGPLKTSTYVEQFGLGFRNNYNFEFADGLNTSVIINKLTLTKAEQLTHIIVEMQEQYSETDSRTLTNTSHWFVSGFQYLRNKQYKFSLVRDVITDYWDTLTNSIKLPSVINRANAIYTNEVAAQYKHTTQLSQVKSGEILLTETDGNSEGARGWLVGYLNKSYTPAESASTQTYKTSVEDANTINLQEINSTDFLSNYSPSKGNIFAVLTSLTWHLQTKGDHTDYLYADFNAFEGAAATWQTNYPSHTSWISSLPVLSDDADFTAWAEVARNLDGDTVLDCFCDDNEAGGLVLDESASEFINTYGDKKVHFKDGFFRVHINRVNSATNTSKCGTNMKNYLLKQFNGLIKTTLSTNIETTQLIDNSFVAYTITLFEEDADFIYTTLSLDHQKTIGANYDVFMCPLGGNISYTDFDGKQVEVPINESRVRAMISALMRELVTGASGNLYDVQWLPYGYCARADLPSFDTTKSSKGLSADNCASLIYTMEATTEKPVGCGAIYWCSGNQSNFTINRELIPSNDKENAIENRIKQETTKYRLTSPNWANGFDFSAVNNDGLSQIDIYCTFKPYQPYIRVAPHFKNLYGAAYNDSRGLILGGEFSLEQVTDAWQQYQLTNKNYQAIFNRQMQTLDLQQQVAAENDVWSLVGSITGVGTGIASGFTQGFGITGGNAVAGGVMAGAAAIGGAADVAQSVRNFQNNAALRDDARQAALDNYQYQLGNIQAQPLGLSRVDSFNIDYRVYPLIEVYKCTTEELQNLRSSIEYNGIEIEQLLTDGLPQHLTDTSTAINFVSAMLIMPPTDSTDTKVPLPQWLALVNTLQSGIYTKAQEE